MAISWVGDGGIAVNTSDNVTPALPAGWAPNDIFLCAITSHDHINCTLPAGWTAIDAGTNDSGENGDLRTTLYYRRAVGGDVAPLVTHGGGGGISAIVVAYRGVILSDPPTGVIGATSTQLSTTMTFHAAGIITTADNDWVIEFGGIYTSGNASGYTGTPTPTERVDEPSVPMYPQLIIADFLQAVAGGTGARACTISGVAKPNNGLLVSFKEEPPPPPYGLSSVGVAIMMG